MVSQLRCLPLSPRIQLQSLLGLAPKCLRNLIRRHFSPSSHQPLRSLDRSDFFVPRRTSVAETRSFATFGALGALFMECPALCLCMRPSFLDSSLCLSRSACVSLSVSASLYVCPCICVSESVCLSVSLLKTYFCSRVFVLGALLNGHSC